MLILSEGWDSYGATADLAKGDWSPPALPGAIVVGGGRFSGNYFTNTSSNNTVGHQSFGECLSASSGNGIAGAFFIVAGWLLITGKPTATSGMYSGVLGTNASFGIATSGQIVLNGGNVGQSGANVADNQWHWFEYRTDTTTGTAPWSWYMDGIQINSGSSSMGTSSNQCVLFCGITSNTGFQVKYDDVIFWNDTVGSQTGELRSSNYPIGPKQIKTLRPTSAGSFTGWTPDSGSNYARVNETTADDDTSYVSGVGSGTKDTYTFGDLAASDTNPLFVNIKTRLKNSSVGSSNFKAVAYNSGSTGLGDSKVAQSAYHHSNSPIYRDPATSAVWTASGINASEFGVVIV